MNKINSRTDWLLDPCFYNCFVCSEPFAEPPRLQKGVLDGRVLTFRIIVDKYGNKEETEERICSKCWATPLSQFAEKDKEEDNWLVNPRPWIYGSFFFFALYLDFFKSFRLKL